MLSSSLQVLLLPRLDNLLTIIPFNNSIVSRLVAMDEMGKFHLRSS